MMKRASTDGPLPNLGRYSYLQSQKKDVSQDFSRRRARRRLVNSGISSGKRRDSTTTSRANPLLGPPGRLHVLPVARECLQGCTGDYLTAIT